MRRRTVIRKVINLRLPCPEYFKVNRSLSWRRLIVLQPYTDLKNMMLFDWVLESV